jgi:Taurine catabolism dioxygenase TauD, TfdA family
MIHHKKRKKHIARQRCVPVPAADLDAVRDAYHADKIAFPWQKGDMLMLDNMLVSLGRESYKGARRILAALS